MARVYNFSAGPSMLPEKVLKQAQAELLEYGDSGQSVMEMSHRSKWFDAIIKDTEASLRRVMNIPDNYKVGFFQGGATQQFAMVPLNFMTTGKADYIVSGNFSGLAAKEAAKFGEAKIVASSKDKNFTYIPDVNAIDYDKDASYIHICQNNTIFGTQYVELPQVEGVPLVADMSSMILSKPVDVTKYGCIYFGVQKNVAPAGMAIAIVRDDLLGHAADTVPTMMNYTTLLAKDSMYNTPPCWCIYMLGLTLDWVETIMFPYNIVEQQGAELIRLCGEKNIGFIDMKPLAGGAIEDGTLALRYVCSNPDVTITIPGMAEIRELEENQKACENQEPLTKEEEEKIQAVRDQLGTDFCRRCNYCAPCSVGIQIPSVFLFAGYLQRYDLEQWARDRYSTLKVKASACIGCGKCEPRCPYHLPIREKLKICAADFGE
mgnify:CR=1 FL=1